MARNRRLTSRERDVLLLVTQGATNREIGTVLHLSRYTVAQHIGSMLRKTGCRTRGQLAYWAATAGSAELSRTLAQTRALKWAHPRDRQAGRRT